MLQSLTTLDILKTIAVCLAAFCLISGPCKAIVTRLRGRTQQPASGGSQPIVISHRPSFSGRVGGHLISHLLISAISNVVGINIALAIVSIILAIPLWLIGADVTLPSFVTGWAKGLVVRVQDTFRGKKADLKEKLHDTKDAVVEKITGRKHEAETWTSSVPLDSDEFWGGPRVPSPTKELWHRETMAFDALPPEQKLAILETAKPLDTALPSDFPDIYAPLDWHRFRIGRSTWKYATPERIALLKMMWTADRDYTHHMDAKIRAHFTRLSRPVQPPPMNACGENFKTLPPAERFATLNAALKLLRPLPKQIKIAESESRDNQFYYVQYCQCWVWAYSRETLEKEKDLAFEDMRAVEIAAAEAKSFRFARAAREKAVDFAGSVHDKAEDLADSVKARAATVKAKSTDFAHDLKDKAADLKTKSKDFAHELGDKAAEGVKEGASRAVKDMFWKSLGY